MTRCGGVLGHSWTAQHFWRRQFTGRGTKHGQSGWPGSWVRFL